MARSALWWLSAIGGSLFLIAVLWYNIFYVSSESDLLLSKSSTERHCSWKPGDPVIYNLKTKMGVNYDAGHWFHMSENFMTQHSILRAKGMLTNATDVFYNFDADGFTNALNGVTRFMVYLGTKGPLSKTNKLNYIHISNPNILGLKVHESVALDSNVVSSIQTVDLSDASAATRFVKLSHPSIDLSVATAPAAASSAVASPAGSTTSSSSSSSSGEVCAKFMGSIGGMWPTPQRGHWFPNAGDTESFRQKMKDACPADKTMLASTVKTKKFKLVIYNRDLSRMLANEKEAISMLRAKLTEDLWEIQVIMHSSSRGPCELAHLFYNVDMLITPHGFQSMLLMFLPRPAVVFEVFPYRYFKRGYGPFSQEYGVVHSGVMSPAMTWHSKFFLSFVTTEWCMLSKNCRGYARNQDVKLTQNGVNKVVEVVNSHPELFGSDESKWVKNRDLLYKL